jgi:hypothetical protein
MSYTMSEFNTGLWYNGLIRAGIQTYVTLALGREAFRNAEFLKMVECLFSK